MPLEVGYTVSDEFLNYAYVLDKNFVTKMIIDTFESFVWTERYKSCGEFVLTIPLMENVLAYLDIGDFLTIKESNRVMVIETMTLISDSENGDKLELTGRTAESVLERRIIWGWLKEKEKKTLQDAIELVLNKNVIEPEDEKRKLSNIRFYKVEGNEILDSIELEIDLMCENVYTLIEDWCNANNVGFRMVLDKEKTYEDGLVFELYLGEDRSRNQDKNAVVVFSDSYENLMSSNFVQSEVNYASNALIAGEDADSLVEVMRKNERTGYDRREIYIETGVTDEDKNDPENKGKKFEELLLQKAREEMSKHSVTIAFEGEADTYHQFIYGKDYFLGDIVQLENKYGFSGRCRIDEVVKTRDASGPSCIPAFIGVDEDEEVVAKDEEEE